MMNTRFVAAVMSVCALSLGAPAFSQDQGRAGTTRSTTPASQEFSFTDELVQGQLQRPDVTTVRGGRRSSGINLIRHRSNFVQEMFKSVENL